MPRAEAIRVTDTCNVWVIRTGTEAVCIDFGSGLVLEQLDTLGIERVTDVLVTHHHRDVTAGLRRAVDAGARVWVPPVERALIDSVDDFWARHRSENDYDVKQHRFSLLEPVDVAGTVDEYRTRRYGDVEIFTLPTPGHTIGSVSYLVELDGRRVAFTGDLLYAPGKVWSLAATQWSYSGVEGQASTILSLLALARREPAVLYPAHGEPMADAPRALAETAESLTEIMELRREAERPWNLRQWIDDPWQVLSPHLLLNRTSLATAYALLSDSGSALLIDWGYDLWTVGPLGGERWTCRPLIESIDALKRNHGVDHVEVVAATHYHDDHVAGMNLLREVEGTEIWAAETVAPVMEDPMRYDMPCLWFEPVQVDRTVPLETAVEWHEYRLTFHPLPGHTRYQTAIEIEVDGRKALATGDQQSGGQASRPVLNYQYRNRFAIDDYVASADLYARIRPDLLLTGHWGVVPVDDDVIATLRDDGRRLAELHRRLLPLDDVDFGAEGFAARLVPYRRSARAGETVAYEVELLNPFGRLAQADVRLLVPVGWKVEPEMARITLDAHAAGAVRFGVGVGGLGRAVLAADVTVDGCLFGQQAEAFVCVA